MIPRLKAAARNNLRTRAAYKFFVRNWTQPGDAQRSADVMATMRHVRVLDSVTLNGPKAQRIVVIAPHPDDEVIGPGGTLLRLLRHGADATVLYLTDGEALSDQPAPARQEAEHVARMLGFHTLFLGHCPGNIPLDKQALRAFADAIIKARPEALFLPFLLDDHDDHRRANHLLMAAVEAGLLRLKIDVWAYQVYTPLPGNVVVDISDEAERKAQVIRLFASQMAKRDWAHFALGLNAFNIRLLPPTDRAAYAEAFFVLPIRDYVHLCEDYFSRDSSPCYVSSGYRASQRG